MVARAAKERAVRQAAAPWEAWVAAETAVLAAAKPAADTLVADTPAAEAVAVALVLPVLAASAAALALPAAAAATREVTAAKAECSNYFFGFAMYESSTFAMRSAKIPSATRNLRLSSRARFRTTIAYERTSCR